MGFTRMGPPTGDALWVTVPEQTLIKAEEIVRKDLCNRHHMCDYYNIELVP